MEAEANLHVVIMFCLLHLFTFGLVFRESPKKFLKIGENAPGGLGLKHGTTQLQGRLIPRG